jgi:hypothetical protein
VHCVTYTRRVKCQMGVCYRLRQNMVGVRQHSCEYLVGASACTPTQRRQGNKPRAARRTPTCGT